MTEQTFTVAQQIHTEALNAQAAELSRLRDLVREMREALTAADEFIRNGVEFGYIRMPEQRTPDSAHKTHGLIKAAIAKSKEALKEGGGPVMYGCHYCMDNNQPHDSCLLDTKEDECYYARDLRILRKNKCEHWRPIK